MPDPINNNPFSEYLGAMKSNTPIVLFPVRLETKVVMRHNRGNILHPGETSSTTRQLWVRIFPDTISVDKHQKPITTAEKEAGTAFWTQFNAFVNTADRVKEKNNRLELWKAFSRKYKKGRAKYIVLKTKPDIPASTKTSLPEAATAKLFPDRFALLLRISASDPLKHIATGNVISQPVKVGPNPVILDAELGSGATMPERHDIKVDANGNIIYEAGLEWISDFDKAIEQGLGFRIDLSANGIADDVSKIAQIMVVGLRDAAKKSIDITQLNLLFDAHSFSYQNFSLLPNGAATNNTESGNSYLEEEALKEFELLFEKTPPTSVPVPNSKESTDLNRLRHVFHLDPKILHTVPDRNDTKEAWAMNTALWPATMDYYFREFFPQMKEESMRLAVKNFATEYVSGRGYLPNIRIGSQPYGFVVTSDFRRWKTYSTNTEMSYQLFNVLKQLQSIWDEKLNLVPNLGDLLPSDPELRNKKVVDILKNHPSAVAFEQMTTIDKEIINNYLRMFRSSAQVPSGYRIELDRTTFERMTGHDSGHLKLIEDLVYASGQSRAVKSPTISNLPLSEVNALEKLYSSGKMNYISWIRSQSTLLYLLPENFGTGVTPPNALLYQFLRMALLNLLEVEVKKFLVKNNQATWDSMISPSAYNMDTQLMTKLDYLNIKILGLADFPTADKVTSSTLSGNHFLKKIKTGTYHEALALLENLPTARLERLFAEHIDLCSYRLDAWQTGFFNERLMQQKENGYHIGAFGWLENLDLPTEIPVGQGVGFNGANVLDNVSYRTKANPNAGFIHSYSIPHANTAAVLHNAFFSHGHDLAAEDNPFTMNLTSTRVKQVQDLIEGMQNGQSLAALLGYKLEQFILESTEGHISIAQYLTPLRKANPLYKNTEPVENPTEVIEPYNVINGFSFYNRVKEKANSSGFQTKALVDTAAFYPYEITGLPVRGTIEATKLIAAVNRFFELINSFEDLMLSESVFQQLKGNLDKSSSVLDQISKAQGIQEPEIIRPPRSGKTFTNRIALLFDPVKNVKFPYWEYDTPRSAAEKSLNAWLGKLLPNPKQIYCYCITGDKEFEIGFHELGLEPLDIILMSTDANKPEQSDLGLWITYHIKKQNQLIEDKALRIDLFKRSEKWTDEMSTWGELASYFAQLRQVIQQGRTLNNADFITSSSKDNRREYNISALYNAGGTGKLNQLMSGLENLYAKLEERLEKVKFPLSDELAAELTDILENIARYGHTYAIPKQLNYSVKMPDKELEKERIRSSQLIVDQAKNTLVQIKINLKEAKKLMGHIPKAISVEEKNLEMLEYYTEAAKSLCGDSFRLMPEFMLKDSASIAKSFTREQSITSYYYGKNMANSEKIEMGPAECNLVVNQWIQSVAKVKPLVSSIEKVQQYGESMNVVIDDFHVMQYPESNHWLAVEFPEDCKITKDQLSMVCSYSPETLNYMFEQDKFANFSGLVLDEWTETVPEDKETSAIAFNYNKPNSMPPQSILIAVSPRADLEALNWTWDNLIGTLEDTLNRAKRRAVSPEELEADGNKLGTFLPAVFLPFSSHKSHKLIRPEL